MVLKPCAKVEVKNHDFVIGVKINMLMKVAGSSNTEKITCQIPAIVIECKTYLDKTMLEGASTACEQLKAKNPNALYIVISEWLKLTDNINLKKYKIDQIYILRKQKNTDREIRFLSTYTKLPIYTDVIEHLFSMVREYLSIDWKDGIPFGLEKGYLLLFFFKFIKYLTIYIY
jgi:hypothetical protein